MTITVRPYRHDEDDERVGQSLVRMAGVDVPHRNGLQPCWECVDCHPLWRKVPAPAPAAGEAR